MKSEEHPDHRGFAKFFEFHSSVMGSHWSIYPESDVIKFAFLRNMLVSVWRLNYNRERV